VADNVTVDNGSLGDYIVSADEAHVTADASGLLVNTGRPATSAHSTASVTSSNTSVLASNANRMGAVIYNDSSTIALVKLGASASLTSFSVKLIQDDYYEVPFSYTGAITGITASGTATLRVTEFTA
jgi:hypothetical protein